MSQPVAAHSVARGGGWKTEQNLVVKSPRNVFDHFLSESLDIVIFVDFGTREFSICYFLFFLQSITFLVFFVLA